MGRKRRVFENKFGKVRSRATARVEGGKGIKKRRCQKKKKKPSCKKSPLIEKTFPLFTGKHHRGVHAHRRKRRNMEEIDLPAVNCGLSVPIQRKNLQ